MSFQKINAGEGRMQVGVPRKEGTGRLCLRSTECAPCLLKNCAERRKLLTALVYVVPKTCCERFQTAEDESCAENLKNPMRATIALATYFSPNTNRSSAETLETLPRVSSSSFQLALMLLLFPANGLSSALLPTRKPNWEPTTAQLEFFLSRLII